MKTIFKISIFKLALVAAVFAGSAQAAPTGSYQKTCRSIQQSGDSLNATCRTRSGNWKNTTLNTVGACASEISNNDGNLRCDWAAAPDGSYRQSCSQIKVQGYDLHAACYDINGDLKGSTLKGFANCKPGSVDNLDGILVCDRQ